MPSGTGNAAGRKSLGSTRPTRVFPEKASERGTFLLFASGRLNPGVSSNHFPVNGLD